MVIPPSPELHLKPTAPSLRCLFESKLSKASEGKNRTWTSNLQQYISQSNGSQKSLVIPGSLVMMLISWASCSAVTTGNIFPFLRIGNVTNSLRDIAQCSIFWSVEFYWIHKGLNVTVDLWLLNTNFLFPTAKCKVLFFHLCYLCQLQTMQEREAHIARSWKTSGLRFKLLTFLINFSSDRCPLITTTTG